MPDSIENPWRGAGLNLPAPLPLDDPAPVAHLLKMCPAHQTTPLRSAPQVAGLAGVANLCIKDERGRMGLGSFKALGAAYAIARDAAAQVVDGAWDRALEGRTYVTASAGNHGMSVAAGAPIFGAKAIVYLAETVPTSFAQRLAAKGARVVVEGAEYEASMAAAEKAAAEHGWDFLSDGSWEGYTDPPLRVMEGYLQMAAEAVTQMPAPPSHILLQAGVGGMAAAVAAHARRAWGDAPKIIVVEPAAAPALMGSIKAGKMTTSPGPVSSMGRLDCKVPSIIALRGLARDADHFVTITEEEAAEGVRLLAQNGFATTPSGGAALAALLAGLALPSDAQVLAILSEGPEDG